MDDETPWDYLGLDEDSATKKDAKRAYARRLKVTRPDQKPEEFQKLREAYDLVNQWIDQREWSKRFMSETIDVANDTERETDTDEGVIEFPKEIAEETNDVEADAKDNAPVGKAITYTPLDVPELDEIFRRLREAANMNLEDKFNAAFADGTAFTHDFPDCLDEWGKRVTELCENHPERIVRNFKRKDVVFELENDGRIQSDFLLRDRLKHGAYYDWGVLANHLREDAKRLTNPTAASYFTDLADAIGFVQPNRGTQLLDLAFPYLPPGFRDYEVNRIEFRINRGKMFSGAFAEKRREFWDARIREMENGVEYDWWSEQAREQIGAMNGAMLSQPILNELEHLLPEEIYERVSNARGTGRGSSDVGIPGEKTEIYPKFYALRVVAATIFLLLPMCFLAVKCSNFLFSLNESQISQPSFEPERSNSNLILPDSYNLSRFEEFLGTPNLENSQRPNRQIDPQVEEAFFKNSPRLGSSGLIKMVSQFSEEALSSPLNNTVKGSDEHLRLLKLAATSDSIPVEKRKFILEIIASEFSAENASEALSQLYGEVSGGELRFLIYAELRRLGIDPNEPDKNSLKPAPTTPQ